MISSRRMAALAGVTVASALIVSCSSEAILDSRSVPAETALRLARAVGDEAPYSGVLNEGQFAVCTSRFSDPGRYSYLIEGDRATMKFVTEVSMGPGECVVVGEAKKNLLRKAGEPAIIVTAQTSPHPMYLVRIDESCSADCLVNATAPTLTLSGPAGAVAKYYYYSLTEGQGNHGGTGTINFDLD